MTTISHARAFDAPAPPPAPAPAPVPAERLRWDAVQVTLAVLLGVQVWRVHELFPILAIYGLPFAATVVALLVYWLDRDQRRRIGGLHQPVVRAAVGILALVALSVPGSLYPGLSLGFLLKDYLRSVILMLLVAGSVRGLVDLRRLAWIQLAGVTLLSAVILARAQMTSDGRLHNMDYYDVNDLATLIVCSLPLAVYLWRPARPAARLPLAAAIAFLMMTLGKTGSRGGFLGFLAVAAYLLLRWQAVSGAKRVGTVALLAVLLVAVADDAYFERMQTLLHPSTDYNWSGQSETGRIEVWKRGIGYMASYPVLGVGAQAFNVAEGTLGGARMQQYGKGFKWSAAHNAFIEIGAEIGVLGLILFVALLVAAFRTLSAVRRGPSNEATLVAQALTASLVGFVVTGMFLSQAYSANFYALLGMTIALARISSPRPVAVVPSVPPTHSAAVAYPLRRGVPPDDR